MTYYNEWDPKAAAWLRSLIAAGHLPPGDVDERSVCDVGAVDPGPVAHFFAGVGGWPYALRLAGWPDDRPVWTASLPCQPFSAAGLRRGVDDERHLWPVFRELVAERRPPVLFGEQVASSAGRSWLSSVRADLEALGYAVGASDLCAAGAGAPHLRQRLFWGAVRVADADRIRLRSEGHRPPHGAAKGCSGEAWEQRLRPDVGSACGGDGSGLGRASGPRLEGRSQRRHVAGQRSAGSAGVDPWRPAGWVLCADGRARPLAPESRRVADGVPARVGLLRGFGNAIVPQVAAEFVAAFVESIGL